LKETVVGGIGAVEDFSVEEGDHMAVSNKTKETSR